MSFGYFLRRGNCTLAQKRLQQAIQTVLAANNLGARVFGNVVVPVIDTETGNSLSGVTVLRQQPLVRVFFHGAADIAPEYAIPSHQRTPSRLNIRYGLRL